MGIMVKYGNYGNYYVYLCVLIVMRDYLCLFLINCDFIFTVCLKTNNLRYIA